MAFTVEANGYTDIKNKSSLGLENSTSKDMVQEGTAWSTKGSGIKKHTILSGIANVLSYYFSYSITQSDITNQLLHSVPGSTLDSLRKRLQKVMINHNKSMKPIHSQGV